MVAAVDFRVSYTPCQSNRLDHSQTCAFFFWSGLGKTMNSMSGISSSTFPDDADPLFPDEEDSLNEFSSVDFIS